MYSSSKNARGTKSLDVWVILQNYPRLQFLFGKCLLWTKRLSLALYEYWNSSLALSEHLTSSLALYEHWTSSLVLSENWTSSMALFEHWTSSDRSHIYLQYTWMYIINTNLIIVFWSGISWYQIFHNYYLEIILEYG